MIKTGGTGNQDLPLLNQSKADFDSDLPMGNLAVGYMAAGFDDFQPAHVVDSF